MHVNRELKRSAEKKKNKQLIYSLATIKKFQWRVLLISQVNVYLC